MTRRIMTLELQDMAADLALKLVAIDLRSFFGQREFEKAADVLGKVAEAVKLAGLAASRDTLARASMLLSTAVDLVRLTKDELTTDPDFARYEAALAQLEAASAAVSALSSAWALADEAKADEVGFHGANAEDASPKWAGAEQRLDLVSAYLQRSPETT